MDVIKVGDVIKLVSELLNIDAYKSAKYINDILCLGVNFNQKNSSFEIKRYNYKSKLINDFRNWENKTFQILCEYFHLLIDWRKIENFENNLFIESLKYKDYIDYLIDEIFIYGSDSDKIWFWKNEKILIERIKNTISKSKGEKNE